jgi:hypothetical protein
MDSFGARAKQRQRHGAWLPPRVDAKKDAPPAGRQEIKKPSLKRGLAVHAAAFACYRNDSQSLEARKAVGWLGTFVHHYCR